MSLKKKIVLCTALFQFLTSTVYATPSQKTIECDDEFENLYLTKRSFVS